VKTPPATRDLAIGVVVVVALSRFAPDPFAWPIAAFVSAAVGLGALQIFADATPGAETAGVPIESVLLPALAAGASVLVIRLLPVNVVLALGLAVFGLFVQATLVVEGRMVRSSGPPSSADRTALGVLLLVTGFLAFAGIAGFVTGSGGPTEGGAGRGADAPALAALAILDGLAGVALGYRAAALRSSILRDVAWFAVGAGIVMAVAAIALRSIELPRLIGPALLVLVFFLWDAIHGGRPARRRDPWRAWEMGLLVVLAVAVVAWSFGLRP
jgi:hypothetical protein